MCDMNIYTSYFSKAKYLDSSEYCIVSISRFPPRGFKGVRCLSLAPSADLLSDWKKGMSESEYIRRYRAEMNDLFDLHHIFETLAMFCKGRNMVLCCYEGDGKFCHRHVLSDIVYEKFGYRINELS